MKEKSTPSCCHHQKKSWYREPLFVVVGLIGLIGVIHLILLSQGVGFLSPLLEKFFSYLKLSWWAIGLGLLIGSLVEIFVPEQLMVKWLASGKKSILLAVILGFLASACSHGILAISMSLYKKGASTASTLAFLLAAPWANIAITLLLFSLFGFKAFLVVGGAVIIALTAGFVFQELEKKGIIEGRKRTEGIIRGDKGDKKIRGNFSALFDQLVIGIWSLAKMVVWWVLLGFLLASILGTFIPEAWMDRYFGPSIFGLLATLVLASIIEVCSEGTAPLAFELFKKTGAFGNAFVFLQAGVATDFTEIGLVATNIGKKAAMALILVTVPMILLVGFLFNFLVR